MSLRRLICLSAFIVSIGVTGPKASALGAEISKLLPDDTQMVMCINVRQILDSDLVKKYALPQAEGALKWNASISETASALGLDPFKDVASVTFAAPANVNENKWLVLVRGHFDPAKIHAAAEKFAQSDPKALTFHSEGGLRVYEARPRENSTSMFAVLLDKEGLVISPVKDYVLDAGAKISGKKPTAHDVKLKEFVSQVDDKQCLWLAGLVPEELKAAFARDKQTKAVADHLIGLSGGLALSTDAKAGVRIFLNDAKAARDLRQALVGVQAIAILAVNGNDRLKDYGPLLSDILNSIKFSVDKNLVGIDLIVTSEQIEKAIKK
jgi:hypothetical protein